MKLKKLAMALPLLSLLTGCHSPGFKQYYSSASPTVQRQIFVYESRETLPSNARIKGIARVQNYYPNGEKVPMSKIMEGLKTQAASVGGMGIVNLTSAQAQTTADIVFLN